MAVPIRVQVEAQAEAVTWELHPLPQTHQVQAVVRLAGVRTAHRKNDESVNLRRLAFKLSFHSSVFFIMFLTLVIVAFPLDKSTILLSNFHLRQAISSNNSNSSIVY
ncbi:hypothetical protein [Paenibacillus sp. Soil522]|uniref:hypothetical protein n=1 Tax=Paenibacillus sp. Soil522 TaxID=1736388 RepID=UPI0012DC8E6F|nr:hypothetical protein [Paenibacillus sp. Soil522]